MLGPYLFVFGGLALGLFVGVFVADTRPPILGWLFGAGMGLTGGAFFAAIATGEQLIGGGSRPPPRNYEAEWHEEDG